MSIAPLFGKKLVVIYKKKIQVYLCLVGGLKHQSVSFFEGCIMIYLIYRCFYCFAFEYTVFTYILKKLTFS